MRVRRAGGIPGDGVFFELLNDAGEPVPQVTEFLRHLAARGYSPNTLSAYAYDLLHFTRFLVQQELNYEDFTPRRCFGFLEYLRQVSSQGQPRAAGPTLVAESGQSVRRLSAATINRTLATISSFYEYLIVSEQFTHAGNPLLKEFDRESAWVSDRHRSFLSDVNRQRPVRRLVRVRTVQCVPRPLSDEQVKRLLESLQRWRDKAMVLLMVHGGLRPGEVLNLYLEDIQYGRKRVIIRYRTNHPKRVRSKSRTERVVDLLEPETLEAVTIYLREERPVEATSPFVFLVGGQGESRNEPLGYHALVKLFARHCERLNMRAPWLTPHALRHTHATRMWEGGMRELTLQKRLGHASPESTRMYTRVSDATVVAEYHRALGSKEKK